ncbi:MAG: MMPL family transporter, partial [Hydrocarboniphaga effusa]|nr:MMPL family transporter [Hydrocarboniphaga effusa]
MTDFSAWLARHPWIVVAVVAALSCGALLLCLDPVTGQPRIGIDSSTDRLLPPASRERAVYEQSRTLFGETEAVLVAVTLDPVFTAENLARISQLTERFRELPGVDRVFSLATAPNLLTAGDDIDVRTFTQQAEEEPGRIGEFKGQLDRNPVYQGSLVSADGRVAAFAISLSGVDERMFVAGHYETRIRELAREIAGDVPVWITGNPVIKAATADALLDTLVFTIPLIFGLMIVVLMVAFRSLRATLVCVVAVAIALLWTLATVTAAGLTLNLVTAIVPPLVLTLGLTYAIHVLSEYLKNEQGATGQVADRVLQAARPLRIPALNRGLGFLSRLFSRESSAAERARRT